MGVCVGDIDPPFSMLSADVDNLARLVLTNETKLPFWVTKKQAIHQKICDIKNILDVIEKHGNSWAECYSACKE